MRNSQHIHMYFFFSGRGNAEHTLLYARNFWQNHGFQCICSYFRCNSTRFPSALKGKSLTLGQKTRNTVQTWACVAAWPEALRGLNWFTSPVQAKSYQRVQHTQGNQGQPKSCRFSTRFAWFPGRTNFSKKHEKIDQ